MSSSQKNSPAPPGAVMKFDELAPLLEKYDGVSFLSVAPTQITLAAAAGSAHRGADWLPAATTITAPAFHASAIAACRSSFIPSTVPAVPRAVSSPSDRLITLAWWAVA